jgi:hypothetical protein
LHTADLGGADNLSAAEQAIVRRAAVIMIALEKMEFQFALVDAEGIEAPALDLYQRLSNSLRRLLREVGIKRRSKDITPSHLHPHPCKVCAIICCGLAFWQPVRSEAPFYRCFLG